MQKAAQAEAAQEPKKEEETVRDAEVTNEEPKKEGE
jgi:hypothetical protein